MYSRTHTEEVKNKLRERFKGVSNLPEEKRIEFSDRMKGNGNTFYGKKHSNTSKKLISKSKSIPVIQLNLQGEYMNEYSSSIEAMRCIGRGNVRECLYKRTHKAGGYIWIRRSDYEDINIRNKIVKR